MSQKHCLIIEDDSSSEKHLTDFINKISFLHIVGVCKTYSEAIFFLSNTSVDLIFLDIQLNDDRESNLNGISLLKNLDQLPPVIITTSYAEYALESYEIGKTTDFLLKPYDFDRFLKAINRALVLNVSIRDPFNEGDIFLKVGRSFQRFTVDKIRYMEAYGIYLKVFMDNSNSPIVVSETISTITEHLDNRKFMRVHKSYIINLQKITSFDSNNFFLNNIKIPIGVSYKSKLQNLLKLFDKLDS